MDDPQLLTAKLYFPAARPEWVERPRLVERLRTGLCGPLTLVSAPAGSGKTSLLSEWRAGPGTNTHAAWLSLDVSDNYLPRFLLYMAAALDKLHPGVLLAAQQVLQAPQSLQVELILTTLLYEVDRSPTEKVLVLDDWHIITATPLHQALSFLVEHLPPRLHLVILTRTDPLLPLARLRADRRLVEIRAGDLRFYPSETALFFNHTLNSTCLPPTWLRWTNASRAGLPDCRLHR